MLGVDPDAILIGNGSDDILTILTRAFVPEGGLIVVADAELHPLPHAGRDPGGAVRDGAVHRRLAPARSRGRSRTRT